jgi:hypothetical protein
MQHALQERHCRVVARVKIIAIGVLAVIGSRLVYLVIISNLAWAHSLATVSSGKRRRQLSYPTEWHKVQMILGIVTLDCDTIATRGLSKLLRSKFNFRMGHDGHGCAHVPESDIFSVYGTS